MSAAKHADVLFVKMGENDESDLASYCDGLGIKNIKFSDFSQALPIVQAVVKGSKTVQEALDLGDARART
jgi:2-hydroxy-3-keto-5-methylthiopentenyl-1-phosphate phosphatase